MSQRRLLAKLPAVEEVCYHTPKNVYVAYSSQGAPVNKTSATDWQMVLLWDNVIIIMLRLLY